MRRPPEFGRYIAGHLTTEPGLLTCAPRASAAIPAVVRMMTRRLAFCSTMPTTNLPSSRITGGSRTRNTICRFQDVASPLRCASSCNPRHGYTFSVAGLQYPDCLPIKPRVPEKALPLHDVVASAWTEFLESRTLDGNLPLTTLEDDAFATMVSRLRTDGLGQWKQATVDPVLNPHAEGPYGA